METKIPPSFIPQKSVLNDGPSSHPTSLFYKVGVLVFVVAVLASIGVFGYKKVLEGRIASMEADLNTARASLQPDLIQELSRANARFQSAEKLLNNHITVSSFFNLLESLTLQAVSFNKFTYLMTDSGNVSVTMGGEARSYATVALQAQTFADDDNFDNPQFSDLDLNDDGEVVFTFKSGIKPQLISYSEVFSGDDSVIVPPAGPVEPSTSTSTTP
jgi:hypothetical protein